jgi:hypothetical protein
MFFSHGGIYFLCLLPFLSHSELYLLVSVAKALQNFYHIHSPLVLESIVNHLLWDSMYRTYIVIDKAKDKQNIHTLRLKDFFFIHLKPRIDSFWGVLSCCLTPSILFNFRYKKIKAYLANLCTYIDIEDYTSLCLNIICNR